MEEMRNVGNVGREGEIESGNVEKREAERL